MWEIQFEQGFIRDVRAVVRQHPQIKEELAVAVEVLSETGTLPEGYFLHELDNPGGNYNGHMDFHLSDGLVDVVVHCVMHKGRMVIRFVRMGTHEELFRGRLR